MNHSAQTSSLHQLSLSQETERELQQGHGKRCFGQTLANKGAIGCDIDEDLHAVVPLINNVTGSEFDGYNDIVHSQDELTIHQQHMLKVIQVPRTQVTMSIQSSHHRPCLRVTLIHTRRARKAVAPA